MVKALVVLMMAGTMSIPAAAQTAPSAPGASTTNQAQPAKPQMVKRQICEDTEDNPYSTIHRRVCRTVEVPAQTTGGQQASAPSSSPNSANR